MSLLGKIFIFCGPTLAAAEGRHHLDAVYLPPAAQGDVYQVSLERPWAIGLIDGYFDRVPAVWHKEILWALSHGVHVFGAASMGALRAAELGAFGMEGVGAIFAAYCSGELEDDDEVAVAHGPASFGYRAASEAMVNIRFTLATAVEDGVVSGETAAALVGLGKELFYPERSFAAILARADGQGLPAAELSALSAWLPGGRVDQKHIDAVALLEHIRERQATDPSPKRVRFRFQHTELWEELRRQIALRPPLREGWETDVGAQAVLLDELRRDEVSYRRERAHAVVRLLAMELAQQIGMAVDREDIAVAVERFRRERGLLNPEDLASWLAEQDLTLAGLERLAGDEVLIGRMLESLGAEIEGPFLDHLRISGSYGTLAQRAREKQQSLTHQGLVSPSLADAGLTEEGLWRWYFEERLGRAVPPDLDDYARNLDLPDMTDVRRLALREWEYLRKLPPD